MVDLILPPPVRRRTPHTLQLSVLLALTAGSGALAKGDAAQGRELFESRCALCHSTGPDNRQGPGLAGVVGRKAGSQPGFSYTPALRSSGLTWSAQTLDTFLKSPTALVPGTAMPIRVTEEAERQDLIAYLATLKGKAQPPSPATGQKPSEHTEAAPPPSGVRVGRAAFGSYRDDAPGVRRSFSIDSLPAPYEERSSSNGPSVVARPKGATLQVPAGFRVEPLAAHLEGPRLVRVAPNGDIFVAESRDGRIRALRVPGGAREPERNEVYARGLDEPFGMAFYPPGDAPRWLYVANTNSIVRFPYRNGDLAARGEPTTVLSRLSPQGGGHWTRDLVFAPGGGRMFISVGSASNVAESMAHSPAGGLDAWKRSHALGATWGPEERRADVLVADPEGQHLSVYATGIRNCVGMAISPRTGDLWCSTNERDALGDNLPPDYLTRVREGAFYGWPWYYIGAHEDPRLRGARPDLKDQVTVPDVLVQPHSAPLQMVFYAASQFPNEYRGDAFAAFHGSWNRSLRTGYKIERARMKDGVATGELEDFVTGFVVDEQHVWGRPVGIDVAHDGSLLFTEDGHGTLWRVTYVGA